MTDLPDRILAAMTAEIASDIGDGSTRRRDHANRNRPTNSPPSPQSVVTVVAIVDMDRRYYRRSTMQGATTMSTDDDIVAFIRARLDEEAECALNALRGYTAVTDAGLADWKRSARWYSNYQYVRAVHDIPIPADVLERGDIWTDVATAAHGNYPAAYHIARHNPARVLRGVEAKRRLLVRYERAVAAGDSHPSTYARGQDDGYRQACLDAIRDECSVYADHPDYRPDWSL